jgi:hypothetical protein
MSAKRFAVPLISGVLGGLYCMAIAALAAGLRLVPNFPAYGGESDFGLRFSIFALGVLPCFIVLGGVVARVSAANGRPWTRAVLGATVGTLIIFLIGRMLAPAIEQLPSRSWSNGAVGAFWGGWVLLSLAGILVATRRTPRR